MKEDDREREREREDGRKKERERATHDIEVTVARPGERDDS